MRHNGRMSTILVIGASRGIGLEFVRQYTAQGARVIATARDDAGLNRLREMGAIAHRIDVANPASVSGLAWLLDGEEIDIALYVAGVWSEGDASSPPTLPEFDRVMHTNVLGAMQVIPQVAPLVATSRTGGRFAFISSGMGQISTVASSEAWLYRVSKAALNMALASAQTDYPAVRFIAQCPGWVRTDMGGEHAPLDVEDSVRSMRATLECAEALNVAQYLHHDGQPYSGW